MTLVNGTCGHDVVYRRRVSPRQPLSVAIVWFIEIKDNNFCSPLTKGNHRYDHRFFLSVPCLGYIERRSAGLPKEIFVEATKSNSGVGPVANQYIRKDPSPLSYDGAKVT